MLMQKRLRYFFYFTGRVTGHQFYSQFLGQWEMIDIGLVVFFHQFKTFGITPRGFKQLGMRHRRLDPFSYRHLSFFIKEPGIAKYSAPKHHPICPGLDNFFPRINHITHITIPDDERPSASWRTFGDFYGSLDPIPPSGYEGHFFLRPRMHGNDCWLHLE